MLSLENNTPWQAGLYTGWGPDRRMRLTVVVKLQFRFDTGERVRPLLPGSPIVVGDVYRGEPETSSIRQADESVPFKAGSELLLIGTAYPAQPGDTMRRVGLRLSRDGTVLCRKHLAVTGPRRWRQGLLGMSAGSASPLPPTEVIYENSYGGVDASGSDPRVFAANPAGVGFRRRCRVSDGDPLPAVQPVDGLIVAPGDLPGDAVGFGPIAPGWVPRRSLADVSGQVASADTSCPYPDPVPLALHNAAPADQRLARPLQGGESLDLTGWFPDVSSVSLRLPVSRPWARAVSDTATARLPLAWDTLIVDCEQRTLTALWRGGMAYAPEAATPYRILVDARAPDPHA